MLKSIELHSFSPTQSAGHDAGEEAVELAEESIFVLKRPTLMVVPSAVLDQTDGRGVDGGAEVVGNAAGFARNAETRGHSGHFLTQRGRADKLRAATGQHNPGRKHIIIARL